MINHQLISYSQNHEDMILHVIFSGVEKGFYVDVGAYHPVDHSVTNFFYKRGWRGINIEPNKRLFDNFVKKRKRDMNLNIGISDKKGVLSFCEYLDLDGLSTFSEIIKRSHINANYRTNEYRVKVDSLKNVLKKTKEKVIHFLKIDVEGFEYNVVLGNDWNKYRPIVVVIEGISDGCYSILRENNYEKIFFDGLNNYYIDKKHIDKFNLNNYANVLLSGGYITNKCHNLIEENKKLIVENEILKREVKLLRNRKFSIINLFKRSN